MSSAVIPNGVFAIVVKAITNDQLDWKVGQFIYFLNEGIYGEEVCAAEAALADYHSDKDSADRALTYCKDNVKGVEFEIINYRRESTGLGKIDPEVSAYGTCIAIFAGRSQIIEAIRLLLIEETGARVDWGFIGGRAPMKVLGTPEQIKKARSLIEGYVPQITPMWFQALYE